MLHLTPRHFNSLCLEAAWIEFEIDQFQNHFLIGFHVVEKKKNSKLILKKTNKLGFQVLFSNCLIFLFLTIDKKIFDID